MLDTSTHEATRRRNHKTGKLLPLTRVENKRGGIQIKFGMKGKHMPVCATSTIEKTRMSGCRNGGSIPLVR